MYIFFISGKLCLLPSRNLCEFNCSYFIYLYNNWQRHETDQLFIERERFWSVLMCFHLVSRVFLKCQFQSLCLISYYLIYNLISLCLMLVTHILLFYCYYILLFLELHYILFIYFIVLKIISILYKYIFI